MLQYGQVLVCFLATLAGCTATPARADPGALRGRIAGIDRAAAWGAGPLSVVELPSRQKTVLDTNDCVGPCFSPDGTQVGYVRNGIIWTIDSNGGEPRSTGIPCPGSRVHAQPTGPALYWLDLDSELGKGQYFYWVSPMSPDGDRQRGGWYRCRVGSTKPEAAAISGQRAYWGGISRDGRRASATIGGITQAYAVDMAADTLRHVVRGCNTSVSPDGRYYLHNEGTHRSCRIRLWKNASTVMVLHAETDAEKKPYYIDTQRWSHHAPYVVMWLSRQGGARLCHIVTGDRAYMPGMTAYDFYPAQHDRTSIRLASRGSAPERATPPGQITVYHGRGYLTAKSTKPSRADLGPYTRALIVYEYRKIDNGDGIPTHGGRLRIAHWAYIDRREQTRVTRVRIGQTNDLDVVRLADTPAASDFIANDLPVDPEVPLYLDKSYRLERHHRHRAGLRHLFAYGCDLSRKLPAFRCVRGQVRRLVLGSSPVLPADAPDWFAGDAVQSPRSFDLTVAGAGVTFMAHLYERHLGPDQTPTLETVLWRLAPQDFRNAEHDPLWQAWRESPGYAYDETHASTMLRTPAAPTRWTVPQLDCLPVEREDWWRAPWGMDRIGAAQWAFLADVEDEHARWATARHIGLLGAASARVGDNRVTASSTDTATSAAADDPWTALEKTVGALVGRDLSVTLILTRPEAAPAQAARRQQVATKLRQRFGNRPDVTLVFR